MTDTDPRELVKRIKRVADTMRRMRAATIEAYELDSAAAALTAALDENERLRDALSDLVECSQLTDDADWPKGQDPLSRARAALKGTEQ
ncbi:hypothetical protein [Oceaniglobus trochenteri]|uniref:hypothetical protein n=1 Tax=Oceaniglobus trochenteri TaxID=2763260 RepID=UPI001CFFFE30|nr:hypothetical protein [Oceaniglobus trochenteri]